MGVNKMTGRTKTRGKLMTRKAQEVRDAPLSIRTRPSIKAIAERLALEDDRSITQVLERLILAEAARRDGKPKK
jgi:hypothetical protein